MRAPRTANRETIIVKPQKRRTALEVWNETIIFGPYVGYGQLEVEKRTPIPATSGSSLNWPTSTSPKDTTVELLESVKLIAQFNGTLRCELAHFLARLVPKVELRFPMVENSLMRWRLVLKGRKIERGRVGTITEYGIFIEIQQDKQIVADWFTWCQGNGRVADRWRRDPWVCFIHVK